MRSSPWDVQRSLSNNLSCTVLTPEWHVKDKSGNDLTYWGWNKMVSILQTTFSNVSPLKKMTVFEWNSPEICFSGCYWQVTIVWGNGLVTNKQQCITWTNDDLVRWCPHESLGLNKLTHWGLGKIAAISQTTFWSAFSWMKTFKFQIKFHWSLFLWVQSTIFQHWFR